MNILKVISRLMDYPSAELQGRAAEIEAVIHDAREISPAMRRRLVALLREIYGGDLMDAQEIYTGLFDRGRALSLLLFEHVHGESRDRGQAMVDLMNIYQRDGFTINARELPDFIPLYLEYLAHRPALEVREGLVDISHILGLLSARLQQRESAYACLFDALLMIGGVELNAGELREKVAAEKRDDTPEELDKIWEEEAVTFGAGDALANGCAASPQVPPQRSANDAVAVRWAN